MIETTNYVRPAIQNVSDEELLEDVRLVKSSIAFYKYWQDELNFSREQSQIHAKITALQIQLKANQFKHDQASANIKDGQKRLWNIEIEQARRSDEKAKATVRKTSDAKKTKTREERIDEKYALLPEAFKNSMPVVDVRKFIEDNML